MTNPERERDAAHAETQALHVQETESLQRWKDAVIDAAVVNWCYQKEHDSDPKMALEAVIKTNVQQALDPLISEAAHRLERAAFEAGYYTANDVEPLDAAYAAYQAQRKEQAE